MLTGCRLSEIQKLRWEHVDLDAGELKLPDTKTGGRAVPLAPSAVRLLTSLPRDEDNPWVILGKRSAAGGFQRLRVRFQSRLSGRSQMSFFGWARFMCVS